MTNDEAEKLARELKDDDFDKLHQFRDVRALCNHILSGDMKREIENAAFERAAQECESASAWECHAAALRIRSLIQPPAQKENGE